MITPHPAPRVLAVSPSAPGPWVDELHHLVTAGVDALVLRLTDAPASLPALLDRIQATGLPLGIVVRPVAPGDIARARRAGLAVHLPAHAPPLGPATSWGRSCHDRRALAQAAADGASYALISPVFSPGSKPGDRRPTLGRAGLSALLPAGLPVLALGGMTPARAAACVRAGAHGVAGIGCFFSAGRVRPDATRSLVAAVRGALAETMSG